MEQISGATSADPPALPPVSSLIQDSAGQSCYVYCKSYMPSLNHSESLGSWEKSGCCFYIYFRPSHGVYDDPDDPDESLRSSREMQAEEISRALFSCLFPGDLMGD